GENVQASVFQIDADRVQMAIKSKDTGEGSRISITNAAGDAESINLTNQHATGELDAIFEIDGITFGRSDNVIEDVIAGLSFELINPTTGNEQIEITQDVDTSKKDITDFIEKFNAVNKTIRD